jgi:hypothetical protein
MSHKLDALIAARDAAFAAYLADRDAASKAFADRDAKLAAYLAARDALKAARAAYPSARAEDDALQAALDEEEQCNALQAALDAAFDALPTAADRLEAHLALEAATFEQAFAELAGALDLSPHRLEASEETTEIERLDAVTFALDKLPQLDPHRVTDLLQKTAALAALAAAAAADLEAAAELHEVAFRPELDLSLAVTARAELRAALECLDGLAALSATRERP